MVLLKSNFKHNKLKCQTNQNYINYSKIFSQKLTQSFNCIGVSPLYTENFSLTAIIITALSRKPKPTNGKAALVKTGNLFLKSIKSIFSYLTEVVCLLASELQKLVPKNIKR